jgi:hypothetical protein
VPIVYKSGSLNLLEPSGPVQACNGITLPFYNIPEEHISHLHRGGSLKSRNIHVVHMYLRLRMKGVLKYFVKKGDA